LIGRQQPNNQPDQLASGKDNGALMLMFGDFVIFALEESGVVAVALRNRKSRFAEVIAQINVSRACHRSILSFETAGLVATPLETCILGNLGVVEVKALDASDLGDNAGELVFDWLLIEQK